ncbi:putative NBD/HSP70 family sugar kinase [Conyzicola lurida]|uniref:Putative NBD/HSP70 family sugar kinase n=1 Tax=Conyzicola lurida TaxID=1172621 RepID=A0A841AHP5_9MICO|nr:ROK family protein [Conyzicola lurida]MBB5841934.1 putative NBD/HSP70 family sugar kinase [Conyzicola lurida]
MRMGIDIGGTKTEAVTVADDGTVVDRVRLATGFGAEAVIASTVDAVGRLTAASGGARFSSVGVGIPGAVDAATGRVSHAINLGLDRLDLGELLAAELGTPVRVENDVNAAALGAFHLLEQPAAASMSYLNLGTGLAAGLVLRGELWRGARGGAGEIGHILVDPAGPLDLDGQHGGLEAMASGSGIARQWARGDGNAVSAVLDAADAGDERAVEIRRRLYEGVAHSVRILVLTVDVDLVVIGGGIAGLGDRVLGGVFEILDSWSAQSPFIESLGLAERLRLLPAGAPVAALGAAHLGGTSWPK